MNVDQCGGKAKPAGPRRRKDVTLLRCFYCGQIGHIKALCAVRKYRLERLEKRRTGSESHGDQETRSASESA